MSHRTARIGKVIQQEITALLQRGALKDPRIHPMTTVTATEVSRDLSYTKVFFSVLQGDEDAVRETRTGLEAAKGYLQRHLARVLSVRNVPNLTFEHDASFAYGDRINRLLSSLPELKVEAAPDDEDASEPATDEESE